MVPVGSVGLGNRTWRADRHFAGASYSGGIVPNGGESHSPIIPIQVAENKPNAPAHSAVGKASFLFGRLTIFARIAQRGRLANRLSRVLCRCQKVLAMSQNLILPDELFNKLAHGAARRGLTIEALLGFVSELVELPDRPTQRDRERQRRIERLLAKYKAGPLTAKDRTELNQLIDADYHEAIARADRLIAAKESPSHTSAMPPTAPSVRSSLRPTKRTRK
jgi:hypothetical protein